MHNTPNSGRHRFQFRDAARETQPKSRASVDDACIDWYLNDDAVAQAFTSRLPRELAGLEDIACTVYLADRLARRPSPNRGEHEESWGRDLQLEIPVADLA